MLGKSFRHIPYRFATMLVASMRAGDDDNTNEDASDEEDTSEGDGKNTDQKKRSPKDKSSGNGKTDGDDNRSKKVGGKGDGDESSDEDESKERKFTQDELDRAIEKRLADERKRNERKQAEKQGKFEELYTSTKADLETAQSEIEKLTKRAEGAEAQVHRVIDSQIKDWPSSVREMDPGKDAPIEQRTAFVERGKKLAAELVASKKAPDLEGGNHNGKNGKDGSKSVVSNYLSRTYGGPKSAQKKG